MYCIRCGLENLEGSMRCIRCGQDLSTLRTDRYTKPVIDSSKPLIWNPDFAALLSILFSPIFGAVIHALNWRRLGLPRRAIAAWFWAGLIAFAFFGVAVYGEIARLNDRTIDIFLRLTQLSALILWYFGTARAQGKFIVSQFGNEYHRESWFTPVLVAVVLVSASYGLIGALR